MLYLIAEFIALMKEPYDMSSAAMKIFEWTPEYAVHVDEIDREHQILFDDVNNLHEAMLAGKGAEILGTLLAKMTQYGIYHFANEEKLMATFRYPEIRTQAQQHEELRRGLKAMRERFERGETTITIELMLFLTRTLKNHVMVTDRLLGVYIKAEQDLTTYLERLLKGDHRGCSVIVQRLLAEGTPIKDLYVNLFQRALYHVGKLWEQSRLSVATEHLAASITTSMMTLVYPKLVASPRNGKSAVVTCVSSELHQIGAKMVADTFELHGWDAYFLGANTPLAGLLELLEEKQPDVLCLSVSLRSNVGQFKQTIKKLRSHYPGLDILAGGQALEPNRAEVMSDPHLQYLRSLDELEVWMANRLATDGCS
jgi:hemerythrin-like metal-binding protein